MKKLCVVLAGVLLLFGVVGSASADGLVYDLAGVMVNETIGAMLGYTVGEVTDPPYGDLVFKDGYVPTPGGSFTEADVAAANIYFQDRNVGALLSYVPGVDTMEGTFSSTDITNGQPEVHTWIFVSAVGGTGELTADDEFLVYGNPSGMDLNCTDATMVAQGDGPPPEFDGTGIQITGTSSNITMNVMAGDTVEFTVNAIEMDSLPME